MPGDRNAVGKAGPSTSTSNSTSSSSESYAARRAKNLESLRQSLIENPPEPAGGASSASGNASTVQQDENVELNRDRRTGNSRKAGQKEKKQDKINTSTSSNTNHQTQSQSQSQSQSQRTKSQSNLNLPSYVTNDFQVSKISKQRILSIEYPSFLCHDPIGVPFRPHSNPNSDSDPDPDSDSNPNSNSNSNFISNSNSSHRPPPTSCRSLNSALKSLDPSNQSAHSALVHLATVLSKSISGANEAKRYELIKDPVTLILDYSRSAARQGRQKDDMPTDHLIRGKQTQAESIAGQDSSFLQSPTASAAQGNLDQEERKIQSQKEQDEETELLQHFRHPILGNLQESGNLVAVISKKKWRKRRKGKESQANGNGNGNGKGVQEEEEIVKEYSFENIAVANKTVRFRAIADFGFKPSVGKNQLQDLFHLEGEENVGEGAEIGHGDGDGDVEMSAIPDLSKETATGTSASSSKRPLTSDSIKYTVRSSKDAKGLPRSKNTLDLVKALVQMDYKAFLEYRLVEDWNTGLGLEEEEEDIAAGVGSADGEGQVGERQGETEKALEKDSNSIPSRDDSAFQARKEKSQIKNYKSIHMVPPPLFSQSVTPWLYDFRQNYTSAPRIHPLPPSLKSSFLKGSYQPTKSHLFQKLPEEEKEKLLNQERALSSASNQGGSGKELEKKELYGIRFLNNKRIKNHVPQELRIIELVRGVGRIRMEGEVPQSPTPFHELSRSSCDKVILKKLKDLFDQRPMWSRRALFNQFQPDQVRKLANQKIHLYLICYRIVDGPWKDILTSWGYDPRKERESRFYQQIYWRNTKSSEKYSYVVPLKKRIGASSSKTDAGVGHIGSASEETDEEQQEEEGEEERSSRASGSEVGRDPDSRERSGEAPKPNANKSHTFDGSSTFHEPQRLFQLCDISDPKPSRYIQTTELLESPDPKTGWFTQESFARIRLVLSHRLDHAELGQVEKGEEELEEVMESFELKLREKEKDGEESDMKDQDEDQDEEEEKEKERVDENQDDDLGDQDEFEDLEDEMNVDQGPNDDSTASTSRSKSEAKDKGKGKAKAKAKSKASTSASASNPSSSKRKGASLAPPEAGLDPEGDVQMDLSNEATAQLFKEARKIVPKPKPSRKGKGGAKKAGEKEQEKVDLSAGDRVERSRKKK